MSIKSASSFGWKLCSPPYSQALQSSIPKSKEELLLKKKHEIIMIICVCIYINIFVLGNSYHDEVGEVYRNGKKNISLLFKCKMNACVIKPSAL